MSRVRRLLLVDGNDLLRTSLAEQLAREGSHVVIEAGSAQAARAAAKSDCDLAIIEQALPDGDGAILAKELRQTGFTAPILLLSDNENGAFAAVSEIIAKPFRFIHLLARLHAHGSRHAAHDEAPMAIGPYQFRPGARLLTDGAGRKVRLTEKESNILQFLHAAATTVPRETLLHEVWGYNPAVTTHTLETHIYRLRRKIEENPGKSAILVTEGGGYRLAQSPA